MKPKKKHETRILEDILRVGAIVHVSKLVLNGFNLWIQMFTLQKNVY